MRGTNSAVMKENNRRLILNLIRNNKYSRTEIASKTALTKATVTLITNELIGEGLIEETFVQKNVGVGRNPTCLELKKNSRFVISVSMTRTEYKVQLYNIGGNVLYSYSFQYAVTPLESALQIAKNIKKISEKVDKSKIIGVGVICPGPVDYKTGKLLNPPNFDDWHDFELGEMLKKECEFPIFIENISNSLAIYENYFGQCKNELNFAYVIIDDGIGSGIVVNGDIYRGALGYGNEIGHTTIDLNGRQCSCGNKGCLECYASIPSILSETKYSSWKEVLKDNNQELFNKECNYLSAGLISLINLFDLNAVIIGGDVATQQMANAIYDKIKNTVIVRHPIRIGYSDYGKIRGAAAASIVLHNLMF